MKKYDEIIKNAIASFPNSEELVKQVNKLFSKQIETFSYELYEIIEGAIEQTIYDTLPVNFNEFAKLQKEIADVRGKLYQEREVQTDKLLKLENFLKTQEPFNKKAFDYFNDLFCNEE